MKDIKKIINKPIFFIIVSIVVSIVATIILVPFLIFPKFESLLDSRSQNLKLEDDIDNLKNRINAASSLNMDEVSSYYSAVKTFIPEGRDSLRFLTLNDMVASVSGVSIKSVSIEEAKAAQQKTNSASQQGVSVAQSQESSSQANQQATTSTQPNKNNSVSYFVDFSIAGDFEDILRFISNCQESDRLIGINEISIAGEKAELTADLTMELPLGNYSASANPEDDLSFTAEEKEIIDSILYKKFSATPSNNPLGRPDPFD